ncbi:hypothetical protein [Streptomyces kanamyceticus]|nr:hypothetical protein [Streptomyces kanamyceticus]
MRPADELTSRRILVEPDRWHAAPRPYTVDPYGLVAKAGTW